MRPTMAPEPKPRRCFILSAKTRVDHIVKTFTERIATGMYPVDSKLPSCRSVAKEFQVSSATAHSAYQELEHFGLVRNEARVGAFVSRQRPVQSPATSDALRSSLSRWIQNARRMGFRQDFLTDLFKQQLSDTYATPITRIIFVECNRHDADHVARRVSRTLGIDVIPILVDELPQWLTSQQQNDNRILITTTYYHLTEVKELADPFGLIPIGLHHAPGEETAAKIAELPGHIHLGAVATNKRTLQRLVALATMYHGPPQSEALADDEEALDALRRRADVIIDTFSCHDRVIEGMENPERVITVQFKISENSLLELRDKLLAEFNPEGGVAAGETANTSAGAK